MSTAVEATASYLGYLHQGYYALLRLIDATDEASVGIEIGDDVQLHDSWDELHQIKHLAEGAKLSIADRGLWKAIGNWLDADASGEKALILATTAELGAEFTATCLLHDSPRTDRELRAAANTFRDEAERVLREREDARRAGKTKLPNEDRARHCQRFVDLGEQGQYDLFRRTFIVTSSFRIADIEAELSTRLRGIVPLDVRTNLARSILRWWSFRVVEALRRSRSPFIPRGELVSEAFRLAGEVVRTRVADSFAAIEPSKWEELVPDRMRRQIELVQGGEGRVRRAAIARWKALSQTVQWVDEDAQNDDLVTWYRSELTREWSYKFEPLRDDASSAPEDAKIAAGKGLLDWSHDHAHLEVRKITPEWRSPYLVRGLLQDLASLGDVGWHPDFKARLGLGVDDD